MLLKINVKLNNFYKQRELKIRYGSKMRFKGNKSQTINKISVIIKLKQNNYNIKTKIKGDYISISFYACLMLFRLYIFFITIKNFLLRVHRKVKRSRREPKQPLHEDLHDNCDTKMEWISRKHKDLKSLVK